MSFEESMSESVEQIVEVIGFGRRLVAYILDAVILWIVQAAIFFCGGGLLSLVGGDDSSGASLVISCLVFIVSVGYFVAFWATTGQTPGKMALGIKVIDTDGAPLSWGKAFLRYVGYIVSGVILSIGFLWIAFDDKRQGWHDKIAGTYVVGKDTHFSAADGVSLVPSDEGSSTGIVLAILAGLFFIAAPIVICAILLLLGPAVGNTFSTIIEGLE